MPFVTRCRRCGYIEYTLTRDILKICLKEHDLASHGNHPVEDWTEKPLTWVITIVSEADFYMIQRMSKIPSFWQVQRLPKRQVQVAKEPLISGLVSGEIKPFCILNEQSQQG